MPIYTVTLSDTVTYRRDGSIRIKARNVAEASRVAEGLTDSLSVPEAHRVTEPGRPADGVFHLDEDQVGNTPWEVAVRDPRGVLHKVLGD